MKLDRVFIGFTKDGKERLLYKTYKTAYTDVGEESYTEFIDLNNKKALDVFDVDTDSLKPISALLNNKKRMMKNNIIKKYKLMKKNN